ncbi:hypothetical protein M1307_03780 [Patescibacteria group bacterium]|nr:hypothetical protein [Patescibacteria group bacterium]
MSKRKKLLTKNRKTITVASILGFLSFFLVDPVATHWGAWGFDYTKTLGINFGKSVIEELIWNILVFNILALVVISAAEKEEKKEPLISILRDN